MSDPLARTARRLALSGVVQGVGFRPFIYRHAKFFSLFGWVRNTSGRVDVHIQGVPGSVEEFIATLLSSAPGLSAPVIDSVEETPLINSTEFLILESRADENANIQLPADLFCCDDCLREADDPDNRRFRYPFINCTQCGPRYTLIEALPYDRVNTSMSTFPLCQECQAEYTDPLDRRYHAEPIACETCGPVLSFFQPGNRLVKGNQLALSAAIKSLRTGKVIAAKGIGGYHLLCDASHDDSVARLRRRKPRPHKPLAVLFPMPANDPLGAIHEFLLPSALELELLQSPARPIVLVRKKPGSGLADGIAPGLNEIGAMLPYSPLHHLLTEAFGGPLVATSANLSGEPVLTLNEQVEQRLGHVADAVLHHDRPIVRPADDPVIRVMHKRAATIRQGRGMAPVEMRLPFKLKTPVLAVGAHMKNTIALAWGDRIVMSPHIGEMDNPRSLAVFEQSISDLQSLYQQRFEQIVCDAHRGYTSARWARSQGYPVVEVYHHHAHASAAFAGAIESQGPVDPMLIFTWDGVGLGEDGSLWGGEAFLGQPGNWRRVASFRPFRLPGGERAGREPWRSAAAICWESGFECPLEEADDPLLYSFWQQGRNAPQSTAVGRLFDAASALTGVCTQASFEGQGPMYLETLATDAGGKRSIEMELSNEDGLYRADWSALISMLTDTGLKVADRAACFHASMAHCLLRQAEAIRDDSKVNRVALSGGVFQNRILTEMSAKLLETAGFEVSTPSAIPVNDAGISFGQVVEYGYSLR